MIRMTLFALAPLLLLVGCSFFREDPKIAEAEASTTAALSEYEATVESGDAVRIAAARAKLDASIAEYEALVDGVARKYDDLGGWGATVGGIFGPVGVAVGGIAGTLGAGIMGWAKTRKLKSFLVGIQAAREDLAANQPGAAKLADEAMRKAIPKELQDLVRILKKKGVLSTLA